MIDPVSQLSNGDRQAGDGLPLDPLALPICAHAGKWRFVLLVEIENFVVFRRQYGRARADMLVTEIMAALRDLVDGATAIGIGRGIIEVGFESDERVALTAAIASIETAFRSTAGYRRRKN